MLIKTKYLLLGGGISSISLSHFLNNDDYLIVEKDSRIGGLCKSFISNDYSWDYSGHFMHFKDSDIHKMFIDKLSNKMIKVTKNTSIYYNGEFIDYPFQNNISQLSKNEFIDCLYDFYNRSKISNSTFKDKLYSEQGKSISDKFTIPYNEKLYCCELNELDYDCMGRFFPKISMDSIINSMKDKINDSYNNYFYYFKNGIETIFDVFNYKKENILLNTEVKDINYTNKFVILSDNSKIEYEYLINSIPFNKFLEFVSLDNNLLSYNKVKVLNIKFRNKSIRKDHWIYFPQKELIFYRIGFYNNILNKDEINCYVEISQKQDGYFMTNDKILKTVINDLIKIGLIPSNYEIEKYQFLEMNPAYVHLNTKSKEYCNKIMTDLSKFDIYFIGRYGTWEYLSIEDCILQSKKLSEILNEGGSSRNR